MPRIARRPVGPRRGLTALQCYQLMSGVWFFARDPDRLLEEDLADRWTEWRAYLVPLHVEAFPGSRPWGWWEYDAPEERDAAVEEQWQYLARLRLWLPGEASRCTALDCWHRTFEAPYGPHIALDQVREWLAAWQSA